MDVELSALAKAIVAEVGVSTPVATFRFVESTGDLMEDDSAYITLTDGRRLQVTFDLIDKAVKRLCTDCVARGLTVNGTVVSNWRSHPTLGPGSASTLSLHLEEIPAKAPSASMVSLAAALTKYFDDLPTDFDRACLNHLPKPSVWPQIVHRFLCERGYPHLVTGIRYVASEVSEDIAVSICGEIVRADAAIIGPSAKGDVEETRPANPEQIRVWAESLLSLLFDKYE